MQVDTVWTNAKVLTMRAGAAPVPDGVVAARGGCIVYAGAALAAPELAAHQTIDCEGRWITPALIDAHTHLIHMGNRAREFQLRLEGASYEEIARAGGGIVSTMRATRAASVEQMVAAALPRLDQLIGEGLGTIEIKSGYGLELSAELNMLRAARALGDARRVRVRTTFLGAHAVPPEFAGDADGYIEEVCNVMLPAVAAEGLADAVDGFCEGIGFTPAQIERVFVKARELGLPVKLHAEQLSNLNGAALAAQFGALSADHLEYLDEAGVAALAAAGSVAMLLPGAYYFCRETQLPPVDLLRAAGVPIAVATDCNPGTSPLTSLLLAMNMAATCFRLTVAECLAGVTLNAAKALGLQDECGSLEPGKSCDLALWNIEEPAELVYRMGANPLHARVWRGQ